MPRHDAVLIRVSTDQQDHNGQRGNVREMLERRGTTVPQPYWFEYTVSRAKVSNCPEFQNFMEQVQAGLIGTAYVESRDRFGQTESHEYFNIIHTLRTNGTRLVALRERADLTEANIGEDVQAVVGAYKNKDKLKDTGYQSLRTRLANFKATGSWPTGPQPFGYAKACHTPGGVLRWVWQPVSRTLGRMYYADAAGVLPDEPSNTTPVKIQRKERTDIIKLVPSNNPDYTKAVQRVFELYTGLALSRRGVSKRLNEEGLRYYGKPFTHSLVTGILENPAYKGDTHFGKTRVGDYYSFDADGQLDKQEQGTPANKYRGEAERMVVEGTHEALVDKAVWERAKEKLIAEQERVQPCFAPRNPAYFLKGILHCGHCGKPMRGRSENGVMRYVCSTYQNATSSGQESECGYYTIKHDDAVQLLQDKLREQNIEFEQAMSEAARDNLQERLARLGDDEEFSGQFQAYATEGINALARFLIDEYGVDYPEVQRVRGLALDHFYDDPPAVDRFRRLPFGLDDFKRALAAVESSLVAEAEAKVAEANRVVERYTVAWVEAEGVQRDVLKRKADEAEAELQLWQPRTVPLSERIEVLCHRDRQQQEERQRLLAELPNLEYRERGEAFARLFKRVDFYWDADWVPAKPGTPKRTKRKGRYKNTLRHDLTQWEMATTDLGGGW